MKVHVLVVCVKVDKKLDTAQNNICLGWVGGGGGPYWGVL